MKLSLRAYLLARRVQRLGRWVSSFLAIVLTGKARVVLAITDCIFGAIWQIREICKPVSEPTRRHNMFRKNLNASKPSEHPPQVEECLKV